MLRITVEIVPRGDESRARRVARAEIANLSDRGTICTYRINASEEPNLITGAPAQAWTGAIEQHDRRASVWSLIAKVATWAAEQAVSKTSHS